MFAVGHGGYRQIVFLGERACENIRASRSDGRSCRNVPPVVLLAESAAPSHVCGKHVCRRAEFPSVAPLHESCVGKQDAGVRRRKRVVVASVGALFLDSRYVAPSVVAVVNAACFSPVQSFSIITPVRVANGIATSSTSPDVFTPLRALLSSVCAVIDKGADRQNIKIINRCFISLFD